MSQEAALRRAVALHIKGYILGIAALAVNGETAPNPEACADEIIAEVRAFDREKYPAALGSGPFAQRRA